MENHLAVKIDAMQFEVTSYAMHVQSIKHACVYFVEPCHFRQRDDRSVHLYQEANNAASGLYWASKNN